MAGGREHDFRFLPLPIHASLLAEREQAPVQAQEIQVEPRALALRTLRLEQAQVLMRAQVCVLARD
ncbi:hypothetical protein A0U92_06480 [Acetobacter aceti]|uniref:Uncharacterized protein n=1 Tax=Acetobacter aceti TaxID=435 RepID=A0A1U9KF91_ACEAC|nr:hypothetical protein A0U92_06480 [Acetobacter aceti]